MANKDLSKELNKGFEQIKKQEITKELKESYIDYAMSVIISRALPDVRDGLKPVHRRILYAMYEDGLTHSAKFRKSATVVGSTLGRYHPHGDAAVYDALVRMAQDFSLRYPLVQGQGNFGSIDNDPPAAQRYTECKLSKIGEEMLKDIEKDTVDFVPNYDGTRKEPTVLPSPLPNLLLNGSMGIAVGMATNIPPHNLKEVCQAAIYLLDHPEAETSDLFQFIQGPDFPTGGIIFDKKNIISVYSQGNGSILTRGKTEIIEKEKEKFQIVITEIPYQVSKADLIRQFATLVQEKRVEGIKNIIDESDKEGLRITIELQRGVIPQQILNSLYKFSDLEKPFHLNLLALVDGIQPKILSLKEALFYYLEFREKVITRRTKFDLEAAKKRAHILEGLVKALDKIDAVIATIRKSKDRADARVNLMKNFDLTEIQAEAILEIKLHQLARLEKEKIEAELAQKLKEIKELSEILKDKKEVKRVVKEELQKEIETFKDQRRTKVVEIAPGQIEEIDLVPKEEAIITLTYGGYIKRINPKIFHAQLRGGKGMIGIEVQAEDLVKHFFLANTHDLLFFFTDSGKVFRTKVYEVPEGSRTSRGKGIMNLLEISPEEKILSILTLSKEKIESGSGYLVMATKNGIIKKTPLRDFENVRRTGLAAINLKEGDQLCSVRESSGNDEIILVTKLGQSIRFKESEIRPMGRQAAGIKGIRLRKGDEVIEMEVIRSLKGGQKIDQEKRCLLVLTENGFGKKTGLEEYRRQRRGGSGIKTAKITKKTGNLVKAQLLTQEEELIVISQKGQVLKTKINSVPETSRATQGVRIIKLKEGDKVASAICI